MKNRDFTSIYSHAKLGIVHFMAFPDVLQPGGPVLETIRRIAGDDFFTAVEITEIRDETTRREAKKILDASGLAVGYGSQPIILTQKLNLNAENTEEREKAIEVIKRSIDEAEFLGAEGLGVMSGPDPGEVRRERQRSLLIDSLKELCGYARPRGIDIVLEPFDRDIDKKCLMGPYREVKDLADEIRDSYKNFGIQYDLSHVPLIREEAREAMETLGDSLRHIHLGNCVTEKGHPAYGDQHPRFGIDGGENNVEEVRDFLEALLDIGFLNTSQRRFVSLEVKPQPGESSEVVIANAKRVLREAWTSI
ncbi:MAG: TIM barrel protein [Nitrososphaeria archaeon]|nr:TIM barrel protein [Nitrososphaeria archaeon]NIN53254.1 TIM barrel protein [Nitrososphaeria archaeon]NIQ33705.1 TIM barrel protein [Nitrososphaeria archaeon]